jgi:hypothetical protein
MAQVRTKGVSNLYVVRNTFPPISPTGVIVRAGGIRILVLAWLQSPRAGLLYTTATIRPALRAYFWPAARSSIQRATVTCIWCETRLAIQQ